MPLEVKGYQCLSCPKIFGRSEHLRRHALVHSESRPYQCQICSKDFVRRDALTRHHLTHQAPPSLLHRGGRACLNCRRSKSRCSGGIQCSRCSRRRIPCEYSIYNSPDTTSGMPNLRTGSARDLSPQSSHVQPIHQTQNTAQDFPPDTPKASRASFEIDGVPSSSPWPLKHLMNLAAYNHHYVANGSAGVVNHSTVGKPFQPGLTSCRHSGGLPHKQDDSRRAVLPSQSADVQSNSVGSRSTDESPGWNDCHMYIQPRLLRSSPSGMSYLVNDPPLMTTQVADGPDMGWNTTITIRSTVYDEIASLYRQLCTWPFPPWKPLENAELPRKEVFEHFIHLFYAHFAETLPFLHRSLFATKYHHHITIVSMSAIGSGYLDPSGSMRTDLLEFARRCLLYVREATADSRLDSIPEAAAQLLQIVGMAYSEREHYHRRALDSRRELAQTLELCRQELKKCNQASEAHEADNEATWLAWCYRESLVRLASSAWLVDCMLAYHFDSQPTLSLRDMSFALPCKEPLWHAQTAQEWKSLRNDCNFQPSLEEAMQELYINKRLPPESGEFARILMIHGVYQRNWDVQRYFENPLSSWRPSGDRQQHSLPVTISSPCRSTIPEIAFWHNAASDALAIIHQQATTTISHTSDLEHPIILHWHLAEIVLLSPVRQLVELAHAISNGKNSIEDGSAIELKYDAQHWTRHDHGKARLAIVHAGLVLWHLRHFSVSGFYEANSVVLATGTLWAFGFLSQARPLPRTSTSVSNKPGMDSEQCDDTTRKTIIIDRPMDDEILQQFFRNGSSMRIQMTGVEDLCGPRGPEDVLIQSCQLLRSLRWDSGCLWLPIWQKLIDVSRKSRQSRE